MRDGGARRLEEGVVIEQRQVGVEDGGVGGARPGGDDLPVAVDRAAGRGRASSSVRSSPSAPCAAGSVGASPRPPSRNTGPIATPADAATPVSTAPGPGGSVSSGSSCALGAGAAGRVCHPITEPFEGELHERVDGLLRLRSGRGHRQGVPEPRAQCHQVA